MGWRSGKGEPLTVQEIDGLNALLLRLAFKIPELHDRYFREGLAGAAQPQQSKPGINEASYDALARELADILNLEPTPRGFAFERLLTDAFALFDLAPRGSFRLVGEQIDGSFQLDGETYLLEAKWQKQQVGNRELQGSAGSVHSKSAWTRGLFVSYSGFSSEGLDAFARGNATRIICMEGQELWQVMTAKLNLAEVLALKARKAAETGRALVPVSTLYKVFETKSIEAHRGGWANLNSPIKRVPCLIAARCCRAAGADHVEHRPPEPHHRYSRQKVALAALKGEKTLAELAQQFDVRLSTQITAVESTSCSRGQPGCWGPDRSEAVSPVVDVKVFACEDRRVNAGERFLEGALSKAGLLSAKR